MPQTVLKCNKQTLEKMRSFYQKNIIDKKPPGSLFVAKVNLCTITAYQTGKVLFQGTEAEREAGQWGQSISKSTSAASNKKRVDAHDFHPPQGIERLAIIGSDEVGTGDYFGPMTVCAVFTGPDDSDKLVKLGVKDSKLLTDTQISHIAQTLMREELTYSLLFLSNEKYNSLQKKGFSQGKMKAYLHNQAIQHVIKKLNEKPKPFDGILIDQFATPDVYFNYLKNEASVLKENVYFQTKAESLHLSVAAASIIARFSFLQQMDHLSKQAGINLPKGAGAQVDEVAAALIREHGVDYLGHFAKLHFANTRKAEQQA